mmetsp:Transcript_15846/g.49055  ORF Transcript_15846/g.49055 Transcript_15846/m.49055 type:complete len:97 (+) Transcript_15846:279-569(+)
MIEHRWYKAVGDIRVAMQIWDIGGQSIGSKMIDNYLCGAQAVLLCYDITNYESFANLEDWHHLVSRTFGNETMPFIGLVANKCRVRYNSCHLISIR